MKIISWNLRNISLTKLSNKFSAQFTTYGLGNNVLDYMVNLVLGNAQWNGILATNNPADMFVVIELKTGGKYKGTKVTGKCINALTSITNALNKAVAAKYASTTNNYNYAYVVPVLSGNRETVGFIYNTKVFTYNNDITPEKKTSSGTYLQDRTPLSASFKLVAKPTISFTFAGIHAPPEKGGSNRPPIDFCTELEGVPSSSADYSFFLGDFNCCPTDYYVNGRGVTVYPFKDLFTNNYFGTSLPNGTLTSVRSSVDSEAMGDERYLANPFDNIIYYFEDSVSVTSEQAPDLIRLAKNCSATPATNLCPAREIATLNAYNIVSDHIPVIMDLTVT